jgi:hypothetical protein
MRHLPQILYEYDVKIRFGGGLAEGLNAILHSVIK